MKCKQASELISQSLDQPLTWSSRIQLKFHLLICKYCARFNQQMHAMKLALNTLRSAIEDDESITLSVSAKKKIAQEIKKSGASDAH